MARLGPFEFQRGYQLNFKFSFGFSPSTLLAGLLFCVALPGFAQSTAFLDGALTEDSLTFNNPGGQGAGNQHYCVQAFTVDAAGAYTFEMSSPNTTGTPSDALDTFLRLHQTTFDPSNPVGAIASNDDFNGTLTVLPGPYVGIITSTATGFQGDQPSSRLAGVNLTAGTQYFLVHTTWPSSGNTQGGTAGQPVGQFYTGIAGPGAITLGTSDCGGPQIDISPVSFLFTVNEGDIDSDTLTIENIGTGTLVWDIELEDATSSALRGSGFDPLLDEALNVPDFTVVSPANGGTPQVFTIPGGVLTSGLVVGFSFDGTVSGITGTGDWASDMCMQLEGPDGSSYTVGGVSATIPNCNINPWDFQGSGSTDDGTYSSQHANVWPFPPGAQDDGDWTITFIHAWNSASANPMNWSDVIVTLHKVGIPEPCDSPGLVSWLSVAPDAGSTEPGAPSLVNVMVDSAGLSVGSYSANLCMNSNDTAENELIVVPVEFEVLPQVDADLALSMVVTPASVQAGEAISLEATIANEGPVAAEAVSLEVSLPAGVNFVSGGLDQGAGTWNCSEAAGLVTCELTAGTLPVTSQSAVLMIELDVALAAAPGNYSLDGEVISGNDTDPDLGNNTASDSFEVLPFTVTASTAVGQGGITPASQFVASGADASFTLSPDTGWSVDSVAGDTCNPINTAGDQWQAANITADCAVEASFLINSYSLGGSVSGLEGTGLVLSLDGEELLSIADNGPFTFAAELDHGTAWNVSVETQPSGPTQTCTVSNGSSGGIVGDVSNIEVACSTDTFSIGGSVSGLVAAGLQLALNGDQALSVAAGAVSFEFADPLADGSNYDVTVTNQPAGQWCEVSNGQGQLDGAPVTDVLVSCGDVGISFSLNEIDFGTVTVGSSSSIVLSISNPGSTPLSIDGIAPPGSPFEIIANGCSPLPITLEAGESCSLEIRFNNVEPGLQTDELTVSSNADNSPHTIPIRGNGIVAIPVPILSPIGLLLLTLIMLIFGYRSSQRRQRD